MKILFLDIDGVLNSNDWNSRHQEEINVGILIEEEKVQLLAEIINKTDAKIVLHSGWRFWLDDKLKPTRKEAEYLVNTFVKYNIEIYDKTPDLRTKEIRENNKLSLVKAKEILTWLEEHKDIELYLILEDLNLHNEIVKKHQIQTDNEVGLTKEDMERAIKRLNCPLEDMKILNK